MTVEIQKTYRLGEFELDPNKRVLKRADGQSANLANKPFQVLLYFIENRERIVTRQELLDQFWDGRDVYDVTLTKCVGAIRKALGESTETPRFIETRWAAGYRYIGPLEEIDEAVGRELKEESFRETDRHELLEGESSQPIQLADHLSPVTQVKSLDKAVFDSVEKEGGRSRRRVLAFAGLAVLVIGGTLLAFALFRSTPPESLSSIRSVAVLPLKNVPDDAN